MKVLSWVEAGSHVAWMARGGVAVMGFAGPSPNYGSARHWECQGIALLHLAGQSGFFDFDASLFSKQIDTCSGKTLTPDGAAGIKIK